MPNDMTIYNRCAPAMDTGDALLYVGNSLIGKTIGWWVKNILRSSVDGDGPIFTHGNLVLRLREFEGKTDRRWVLDARASGAYPVLLSDYLADYDGPCYWYPLKPAYSAATRVEVGCAALMLAGKPYDKWGLIKNAIGRVSADMKEVFCSESMYLSYREAHIVSGDKAPRPDQMPGLGLFAPPVRLF